MYYNKFYFSSLSTGEQFTRDTTVERDLNLMKSIQIKLLTTPSAKIEEGLVVGSSIPARLIGGDYYDFYPLMNGKIRIVIGDVMGKGIPAAMLMTLTRGAFRTAAESQTSPGKTLSSMNQALYSDLRSLKSFVTLFCADWDPEAAELTYANAGHTMPLHIEGDTQHVSSLPKVPGIMIGGLTDQVYKEHTVTLKPNDVVFFYTDGLIETENKNGEHFRLERLKEVVRSEALKEAGEIEKGVLESIETFIDGAPQRDDMTMVVLKLTSKETNISSFNAPVL
ncbi:serine/threonine-protein phosphatase [Alkalihalophilus marmarensis]|jgi:serine phosphatase RsbU (regulator of sigma subunit)|uniref:PP2C family protein-serine/threonine phosphatase n=1 Tax=Alkalihalophilus marmarensis TaxID=521377 RepID=UPI002041BC6A|nr:PP2C family protein-serine/threonine phosphatase [Alkalihalophilus marmarensis]MCM3489868.1 serine/threonine-protein phosphatase [Alkalihalophilus marmarensis]